MTQVAEVAVNSAGRNGQGLPLREATGSISSPVPVKIMARKHTAISRVALMGLLRCLGFSEEFR